MKIVKAIVLFIVKSSIFLNALFWVAFGIEAVRRHYLDPHKDVLRLIVMLTFSIVAAVAPFALYSLANRQFKFNSNKKKYVSRTFKYIIATMASLPSALRSDIGGLFRFDWSKKNVVETLRNIFTKQSYTLKHDSLEIFQSKDEQWIAHIGCLGSLAFFGILFYQTELVFRFILTPIIIVFVLLTVVNYRDLKNKALILVLSDDKLSYRPWKFKELSFSDVLDAELDKNYLKIKVYDLSKFKKESRLSALESIFDDDDTLYIDTDMLAYDRKELLDIISKKTKSNQTPIRKIIDDKSKGAYIPNQVSLFDRTLTVIVSLSVLAYVINGLIFDGLIIASKRSAITLHGYPIYFMLVAAIFFAVSMLAYVLDHYDRRNNEIIYRKVQTYAFRLSFAIALIGMCAHAYQHERDFVCRNDVIQKVTSADAAKNAYVVKRYCALYDPMNDDSPNYGVSVYSADRDQTPDVPFNTAHFQNCEVKNIFWEEDNLVVEYLVNGAKWNARVERGAPVHATLKIIPP